MSKTSNYLISHPTCELCNSRAVVVHHKLPKSLGGTNATTNLMSLCMDCHKKIHSEGKYSTSNLVRIAKQKALDAEGKMRSTLISSDELIRRIQTLRHPTTDDIIDEIVYLAKEYPHGTCLIDKNIIDVYNKE